MFDYFHGFLTDKKKNSKGAFLTVDLSGVGYLLEVTEKDFLSVQTGNVKEEVKKS